MPITQEDLDSLETKIRERKPQLFLKELDRFMRRHGSDPKTRFIACDALRRMGMFERGYKLVALQGRPREALPLESYEGKCLLWSARFLNLLGATELALDLIRFVKWDSASEDVAEAHRTVGSMYLAHFSYKKALFHFEHWFKSEPEPLSYRSRLNRINLADSYAGLGHYERALTEAREVADHAALPGEALLRGIGLGAIGEYECRRGKHEAGLKYLEEAILLFSPQDTSPDRAFLEKWRGFALCKLGKFADGISSLDKAFDWLRATKSRPEAWLDVLRLKAEVNGTSRFERYPGLAPGFLKLLGANPPLHPKVKKGEWIDLHADEYCLNGKRPILGIPREINLLALVRLAQPWGLSRVRLKSLLWPDSAYAFLQLESRLTMLIQRLRAVHGMEVELSDNILNLSLSRTDLAVLQSPDTRPLFLEQSKKTPFSREEMAKFYALSTTQSWKWLQQWMTRGWIIKVIPESGGKKGVRYRNWSL